MIIHVHIEYSVAKISFDTAENEPFKVPTHKFKSTYAIPRSLRVIRIIRVTKKNIRVSQTKVAWLPAAPTEDVSAGAAVVKFRIQLLDCPAEKLDPDTLRRFEKILAEQLKCKTVNVKIADDQPS